MTYFGVNLPRLGPLELTVIEHFTDMGIVHVHCKQKICTNLIHPRLLPKHLLKSSEVLKNRAHRLYYVVPPLGTVISLDDAIAFDVFFEWFLRNVKKIYAVIVNHTTSDYKKVLNLYLNQVPTEYYMNQAKHFKQTVAKPFSHRPMEPEVDSSMDGRIYKQRSSQSARPSSASMIDGGSIHNKRNPAVANTEKNRLKQ